MVSNGRRGRGAAAPNATPNRSPTGTGSSEKNVNGNEGKHRQIPHVMYEDNRESRMWFREDRSAGAIDEVWTPPKSRLNSNEGLEERRTPELKGMMGCR